MPSVSPYLNQYLSGIVTYEEDQTEVFYSIFSQINFPVLKSFFAFNFTSNFHDDSMMTSPQQASSRSWRWI